MIGIASYDSDESPTAEAPPQPPPLPPAASQASAASSSKAPKSAAAPKASTKISTKINPKRLQEIRKEILGAKSATAVVQIMRRSMDTWDQHWGAEALYQIAKRSTARTRKEWAKVPTVEKLADRLRKEAASEEKMVGKPAIVEIRLLALEGLRRMGLQLVEDMKPAIERIVDGIETDGWTHPVKVLARLFWLTAQLLPTKLPGLERLPQELRDRAAMLDGPDVGLLVQGMRGKGARDAALMQKVIMRLKLEGAHAGLAATDLVEMAEGLQELDAHDEEVLRPLGQEVLRRRGELTPDESHRVHGAYNNMKFPLPNVWQNVGSVRKRDKSEILTTQTFVPQDGHEKKRRGNHDLERVSPPRVVRDYKMASY